VVKHLLTATGLMNAERIILRKAIVVEAGRVYDMSGELIVFSSRATMLYALCELRFESDMPRGIYRKVYVVLRGVVCR